MGQGTQSKALIIASKAQGFDPTRIWDPKTKSYGESIENFDKAPEIFTNQTGTGKLPEGTPDGWPDGYDVPKGMSPGQVPFNTPDHSKSTEGKHTKGGNPHSGMPGAGG